MSFAYLFERFPSFVQTFVYREAVEMVRQGMAPMLVSIRRPDDPVELAEALNLEIFYAIEEKQLRAEVDALREQGKLSWRASRAIPRHRREPDSQRMFESIWLAPHLKRAGVRHVHAHFGGIAARTAWWLKRLFGFRYSFTGHANDIFCENHFPVSNSDLVRDAVFVVTETDYARQWMERKHPSAQGKVFRVFNGIALDGFPLNKPQSGAGILPVTEDANCVPRILSVGRAVEKKGFADLIEACRLLRQEGLKFTCDLIGGGPLENELQSQIERDGLREMVRLLGPMQQSEVRQRLAASRLFVLACVPEKDGGSDNLPTVIMEAMASGVPVVSTQVAGVPEMIDDGSEGFLVAPRDPPALAHAMAKLLRDSELARAMGERGRATAEERFAIENTTRMLKHLLVECAFVTPPLAARQSDPLMPAVSLLGRIRNAWR